jgi:putative flavoprotein involved in K+ transport
MPERIETVVIGAGQAGLAVSYHLTQRGREHVVLERGQVGNTWRTERWDGFYLNTPKFTQQLPGNEYRGAEPDSFSSLEETITYFEEYAEMFSAPIRTGVHISGLRLDARGFRVEVEDGVLEAANVVVATGAYQQPTPAPLAASIPEDVFQLHTSRYRRPDGLPDGAVLVVGGGQSGCQITDELLAAGRTVYLSVGRCPWAPRRYRGREIVHWFIESGFMDETVDTLPSPAARLMCNPPISGNDGGHDCHPRWLAERGAILVGRLRHFEGANAFFAPDLEESLAWGDQILDDLLGKLDRYILASGVDAPEPEARESPARLAVTEKLDLRAADVSTVLWSNGYRPAFGWIDAPLFDADGWPLQSRGVTSYPGLYFVGLHWLHKRKSSLLFGVAEDAEHVVSHLAGEAPAA